MQNRNLIIGSLVGLALVVVAGLFSVFGGGATKPADPASPSSEAPKPSTEANNTTPAATPDANGCVPSGKFTIDPRDVVMGSNDAPITIIEYASMTCPGCAYFHQAVIPSLKTNYVDKGLVRYVFREFPLDQTALAAAVLTRCVPKEAYHPFLATLFLNQRTWAMPGVDTRSELKTLSSRAGLSEAQFDACLKNTVEAQGIVKSRDDGLKQYCIGGTPTTILNGRVLTHEEAASFEALEGTLKAELQKLGKLPAGITPPAPPAGSAPAPEGAAAPAADTPANPAPNPADGPSTDGSAPPSP